MPGQPERIRVTNRVLRFLHSVPGCKCIKIPGGPMMESGTPDIFAMVQGTLFVIECKVQTNRPTAIQQHRLSEWAAAGAIPVVAYKENDVWEALVGAGKSLE